MAHEIAKLLLEQADTFRKRTEAVRTAMQLGMALNDIMQYLDWLELMHDVEPAPQQSDEKLGEAG